MDAERLKALETALRNAHAAGDTAAAKRLANELKRNRGVTSEGPTGPTFAQRAGNFARGVGDASLTAINEALNAATFGLTGQAERHAAGALGKAFGPEEMSYDDFVRQQDAVGRGRRQRSPIAAVGGTMAGTIAPAIASGGSSLLNQAARRVPVSGTMQQVLSRVTNPVVAPTSVASAMNKTASGMFGKGAARGLAGRVAAAAGYGAAENAAIEAGRGEVNSYKDLLQDMGIGAAFGAGGQLAGEGLEAGWKFIGRRRVGSAASREHAARNLADSLFDPKPGPGNIAGAQGLKDSDAAIADAYGRAARTGGPREIMMGETSPEYAQMHLRNIADPETVGQHANTQAMARQRVGQTAGDIRDTLMDNLVDSNRAVTGDAARQQYADMTTQSKKAYSEIFDGDFGRNVPVITKDEFKGRIASAVDADGKPLWNPNNASTAERKTFSKLMKAIDQISGEEVAELTPSGIQGLLVDDVGGQLHALRNPATSGKGWSQRHLTGTKDVIDQTLADLIPPYNDTRTMFALPKQVERAREFGGQVIRGTNTTRPIAEVAEDFGKMSVQEQDAAQDAALEWILGQADEAPNWMRKLKSDNPGMLKRIDAIFGTALSSNTTSADDIVETIQQLVERRKLYQQMDKAVGDSMRTAVTGLGRSSAGDVTDIVGVGAATAAGHPASSSSLYRLGRLLSPDSGAESRLIAEYFQKNNPTSAISLLDELMNARLNPRASLYGGLAGTAAISGPHTLAD